MRVQLPHIEISVGDRLEDHETELMTAGAFVIAVTTIVPRFGAWLSSAYLQSLAGGEVAVSHAWRARHRDETITAGTARLAGSNHTRGCVLDHVAMLREQLTTIADDQVRIDLNDDTLALTADAWVR